MKHTRARLAAAIAVAVISATVLTAGPASARAAEITSMERLSAQRYDVTIKSTALDKAVKTRVLVPEGWQRGSGPYPALYAYHGGQDDAHAVDRCPASLTWSTISSSSRASGS